MDPGRGRRPPAAPPEAPKKPFDVATMLRRIGKAVERYPRAALFELADEGYRSTFAQLVACILSIRTRDETMLPAARALLQRAPTPRAMLELSQEEVDALIRTCSFHEQKAGQILEIARRALEEHGGEIPCDPAVLTGFRGVGPKCAHLVLGIACDQPYIGVDVHVHRVTNRWGYVSAPTPEKTMAALEERLPRRHWVEINARLVPFGKHICTGRLPRCSTCPVLQFCRQVGVTEHR